MGYYNEPKDTEWSVGLMVMCGLVIIVVGTAIVAWCSPPKPKAEHCREWMARCESSQLFTHKECAQQAFLRFECGAKQ